MKRYVFGALLVIFVFIFSLLATLPAHVASRWLPLPAQFSAQSWQGSVWQGKVLGVRYEQMALDELQWQVKPLALLTGKLGLNVKAKQGRALNASAQLYAGLGSLRVAQAKANVDANWLVQQYALPLPGSAEGRLVLNANDFELGSPLCASLNGQINWNGAQLNTPVGELAFDDIRGDLGCRNGEVVATLKHQDALIDLDGDFLLNANSWQLEAKLKAGAELPEMLSQGLSFIGSADPQGYYRVIQSGRF